MLNTSASVRGRLVRVRVLTDATAAGLETLVQDFLAALLEDTLISIQFQAQSGAFSAMITYTR